jgi:bleomycin hydrolase
MKYLAFILFLLLPAVGLHAQQAVTNTNNGIIKVPYTSVKNQDNSGTCWSFSMCSLIESEIMSAGTTGIDISEMFTVRNTYIEKARNYILRQGAAQFGPGGLGHDVVNIMDKYGAVPENVYTGLIPGVKSHDHSVLDKKLKSYLDSLLKNRPIPQDWIQRVKTILDDHLGKAPETFTYNEKVYTPQTFAKDVLKFKREDYVCITSFTHHPFYVPFVLEIPDNYSNQAYYNIPLDEMIKLVEQALTNGHSVMWDTDVSNPNFKQVDGFALQWSDSKKIPKAIDPDAEEMPYDQMIRQQMFENLTTQDDHLMHIVGIEKTKKGKKLFLVKNSWGEIGPFKGFIKVSVPYFAINTVSLIVPKAALDSKLKLKLGIR